MSEGKFLKYKFKIDKNKLQENKNKANELLGRLRVMLLDLPVSERILALELVSYIDLIFKEWKEIIDENFTKKNKKTTNNKKPDKKS
ncbi:MAG: hypothetical protein PH343_05590 [Nitrospira sp.]|nr:hypothetical protein [Nitrospira sp.]